MNRSNDLIFSMKLITMINNFFKEKRTNFSFLNGFKEYKKKTVEFNITHIVIFSLKL